MKSIFSIQFIAILIFVSCGDKDKEAIHDLHGKVMAVHDEIMPKMGDIMKYKKQLKAKIDKLQEAGKEENEARIAELKKTIEDLENSHEEMMNWMREFDGDFEGKVQKEVLDYLNGQMTKIERVGETTNTALKNAEELLKD